MALSIPVSGTKMICDMVEVYSTGQMVRCMKDTGKMTRHLVKEG